MNVCSHQYICINKTQYSTSSSDSSSEVLIQIRKNQFADKKLERASEKRQKIRKINHGSAKKLEPNKNYLHTA